MPAIIKRLTKEGLVHLASGAFGLQAAAQREPRAGVYTVSNTYECTKTLLIDAHLDRLEDSARREGFSPGYERKQLKAALRQMIVESGFGDVRFRVSIPAQAPDEAILSIEPFAAPSPQLIEAGVRCVTSSLARHNPASKSSEWMHRRRALEDARPKGIYETILLDPAGSLLEGASSNVYVMLDGALRTAASGVLAGISRMVVLEVCEGILPLRLDAPNIADIARFDEVFLSSSSRGIIPVVALDGATIGAGRAGAATLALRSAYQRWVAGHLEEL